jgi:hypothetical protein
MALNLITLAAETHADEGVNPWFIGIGTFVFLVAALVALVAFGGGREHS